MRPSESLGRGIMVARDRKPGKLYRSFKVFIVAMSPLYAEPENVSSFKEHNALLY